MAAPHFLVHEAKDNVGVVVVEGVKAGQDLTGWLMEGDKTLTMKVLDDIPLGHKIALSDLKVDDTVIKYSNDIGRVVKDVKKGGHVHIHNLKTKRW
jgi:(2R)-sulfolactate sulfo-lyase subunit alpha